MMFINMAILWLAVAMMLLALLSGYFESAVVFAVIAAVCLTIRVKRGSKEERAEKRRFENMTPEQKEQALLQYRRDENWEQYGR
jgi:membrane protein implicated in regulation of membrane protease activity